MTDDEIQKAICDACGQPLMPYGGMYHARLDVYVHGSCLNTPVCGEDISGHAMWHIASEVKA